MITTSEAMIKTSRIIKYMKVVDMSVGSTIVVEDMEVEVDSLEIATIDHIGPSSALHATKKVMDMQTAHIRIEPI